MYNVELFIAGQLCDTDSSFSVRLNRRLINPAELNTKDAQYSYSISLPATARNNAAFGHLNVEEVAGKFVKEYPAELIINGVRVFSGLFRTTEITANRYKGNLYVPGQKSISEVFGETKMNEVQGHYLPFDDFVTSVNGYNEAARTAVQKAIFPYTLYGLLYKNPQPNGSYSDRTLWDGSVEIVQDDFPPSPNVLQLIRHYFEAKGYALQGTAFSDRRLTDMYMSYRNEPGLEMPWGAAKKVELTLQCHWSNVHILNLLRPEPVGRFIDEDANGAKTPDQLRTYDLLFAQNTMWTVIRDSLGEFTNSTGTPSTQARYIEIPRSGYYKIGLSGRMFFDEGSRTWQGGTLTEGGTLSNRRVSLKVLRDLGDGVFGDIAFQHDGQMYKNNLPQDPAAQVRYFPNYNAATRQLSPVFVDAAQNPHAVVGLQWGKRRNTDEVPSGNTHAMAQVQVAKPAYSWMPGASDVLIRQVVHNPIGYVRWDGSVQSPTSMFQMQLINAPETRAYRPSSVSSDADRSGEGDVHSIVWLNRGERLTVASATDVLNNQHAVYSLDFTLSLSLFRADAGWLKVDSSGKGTDVMDWNDSSDLPNGQIDLAPFMPNDVKIDDFIDNVCKAFNLRLYQTGDRTFALDSKPIRLALSSRYIDLDGIAGGRVNTSLGLPPVYRVGFTVNKDEEGYAEHGTDGGGEYSTGATGVAAVEQKSSFSYNWFKNITKVEPTGNVVLPLAVVSKHEVWVNTPNYAGDMVKLFHDLPFRFWYYDGLLNDLGASFRLVDEAAPLKIAKVSNEIPGISVLSYENQANTLLRNYFMLLIGVGSHYTEVEAYLTPYQYEALDGSATVRYNGDIYYIAELSGYDPTGRNKTKIKLIRKI